MKYDLKLSNFVLSYVNLDACVKSISIFLSSYN